MRLPIFALSAAALGLSVFVAPAWAQETAEPKVNQLIVYGEDKCPESTGDEIVVCARKAESERYRIPPALRTSSSPSNEAWNNKVLAYETIGRSGTQSCSPVGPGGWTGCANKLIRDAYTEKATSSDVKMAELVNAERAKRLQTIDADATATQSRVEEAEKDYFKRQKKIDEAAAKGQVGDEPLPAPPASAAGSVLAPASKP